MNKIIKGIVIAGIAVLAIIGGISAIHSWSSHPAGNMLAGDASTGFPNGITVGGGTYAVSPALAITGSQSVSGTLTTVNVTATGNSSLNGVISTASSTSFIASSTPCAIQSPTSTSTLEYFLGKVASSSAQSTTYTLGTSTNPFATTSALTQFTIGANALNTIAWFPSSPTTGSGYVATSTGILPPSTFVVLGEAGVTGGFPGGTCDAAFVTI